MSSGFDEFEFTSEIPLICLFKDGNISEEEYREIWVAIPKDEHISFDLSLPYSKVIEGTCGRINKYIFYKLKLTKRGKND